MRATAEAVVAAAREATGLNEFDSESFHEGLERVAAYVEGSPVLTEAGRQELTGLAIGLLINRLRIADYARRNPDVLARGVERPVVILGMPRTGTTMLSHLLSLDPARRSLLRWEVFDSTPPARADELTSDPRCLRMKATDENALNTPAEIHLEQADLPIECIVSHAHDFKGMLWAGVVDDPGFQRWVLDSDASSALAFHKLQLQVLQSHTTNHWALKAPAYSLMLGELRAAYPDARLVWTHRDPYRAMASVCSITSAQRARFGPVDEMALGPQLTEAFQAHVMRPLAARRAGEQIYDLHYADLMRDPMGQVERLYAWLGEPLSLEARTAMEAWLAANPRGRFGKHTYGLERFGLSMERLRPAFGEYVEACGVESEAADAA